MVPGQRWRPGCRQAAVGANKALMVGSSMELQKLVQQFPEPIFSLIHCVYH